MIQKMKKWLLFITIGLSSLRLFGQDTPTDSVHVIVTTKLEPKKSNLIFVDSMHLKEDLLQFDKLGRFIKQNNDSLNSFFVWSSNFFLFENRLAITHRKIRSEFDSIGFSFAYDKFLNYQFQERKKIKKSSRTYEIKLLLIVSVDEETVYIGITEPYKAKFYEKKYSFREFF